MKRLLILAYDFPPYVSVGGLRPYAWYRYLKEYGVEPIVVTRQWENKYGNELDYIAPGGSDETIFETTEYGTIIRTPYKPNLANRIMLKYGRSRFALLRRMVTAWYEFMQFLFFVGPKSGLYRGAKEYLKHDKVDAIIATGEPFILFKYASALSRKFNIPWIADYRDPWSQKQVNVSNKIRYKFISANEKRFLSNVTNVITVSEYFVKKISQTVCFPKIQIVPNGYDGEFVKEVESVAQNSDVLRFAFTGSLYDWYPIESVLDGFACFIEKNPAVRIELHFYGINNEDRIKRLVSSRCRILEKSTFFYRKLPNRQLLEYLRSCNVMLLFNNYSVMGTKIYDYIGIRRKIMLCYSDDIDALYLKDSKTNHFDISGISNRLQEELIIETNSGVVIKDRAHLEDAIETLYKEFCDKGYIECNSHGYEMYSREYQTGELAKIIFGENEKE